MEMVPPWCSRLFKTIFKFYVVFVMLCFCVDYGSAITCFVCDSSDNPGCADLSTNSSIVPEECTLEKLKSLDTWLSALNKIAYYNTGVNKSPLINCQKVVAKNPNTQRMVTARFCQLDTGDTDACSILRGKLNIPEDDIYVRPKNYNKNQHQKKGKQNFEKQTEVEKFHCTICTTDRCNGAQPFAGRISVIGSITLAIALLFLSNPYFKLKACSF